MRMTPRRQGAEGQGERSENRPDDIHRAPQAVSSGESTELWITMSRLRCDVQESLGQLALVADLQASPSRSAAVTNVQESLTMAKRVSGKEADALLASRKGNREDVATVGSRDDPAGLPQDGHGAGNVPERSAVIVRKGQRPRGYVAERERR